jgi:hypothetical protein
LPAPVSSTAIRMRARRRPSGEPPPLPRQLQTSGRLIDDFALTIELTRSCDRGQASETATDQPGTRRFDQRIRAGSSYLDRRFYLLPGACMAYQFQLTGAEAEEAAEDISRAIGFVSRDQLADQVRRYSGGRLQLDPERPQQPK